MAVLDRMLATVDEAWNHSLVMLLKSHKIIDPYIAKACMKAFRSMMAWEY